MPQQVIQIACWGFSVSAAQQDKTKSSLPPLPDRLQDNTGFLSLHGFFVKDYYFEGNTVYSDEELATLLSAFRGKTITAEPINEELLLNGYG